MFADSISIFYFLLAFAIGIFITYIFAPKKKLVFKFPSPYNSEKHVYEGDDKKCFKIRAEKTSCPIDSSLIKDQPVQDETEYYLV